jgi:hypothetical protein
VKVAILVPRREGFEDRDKLWLWCRPWWHHRFEGWPIIEGHHVTGLFDRAAAVNTAARLAGDWDVAVIIDADVLIDPPSVKEAVKQAAKSGRMVVPFTTRRDLSAQGTRRVMEGYDGSWLPFVRRTYTDQHSSVVVVPRRLWDAVGGMDEGFSGWGLEDTAFAMAAELVGGRSLEHLPGDVWHLYHKAAPEKHGSLPHSRNVARAGLYRAAWAKRDLGTMKALVAQGRELEAARTVDAIPRILHRVVPETTSDTVETWWGRFGELHPTWRLMTHRDPLDPAHWPLTSPHWAKVTSGAQLADLVRLEALLRWGGFYLDSDCEPFRPLDPLLGAEVVAAWEDERTIPNAVLGARPDHPAIRECLVQCIASLPRGTWEAGPGVTTRVLGKRDDVLVLPPGSFYPTHYRDADREARMPSVSQAPPPWAFVQHWYAGSWLEPERQRPVPELVAA